MTNDEHKEYINEHTKDGVLLFIEVSNLEDKINELERLKRALLKKFAHDNHLLNEGDRIELTWPNGLTEIIDIHTPGSSVTLSDANTYDIVYGYRNPNKDSTKAKIGHLRKLYQNQLFANGYTKL